jgi:hypothetical protein
MGSWNDQGFEGETHAEYLRPSDDVYRLLDTAIVTAANAAGPDAGEWREP